MSIRLMTMIWDSGCYSGGTLLVALALADFAGDDGKRIFPHVETLAEKARLSVRATQLALETLRKDEVIVPVGSTAGGRGKVVEYQMDVKRVQKLRPTEKGEISDSKGCNPRQERVQKKTQRVQKTASHIDNHQEPSKNHQVEPPAPSAPLVGQTKLDLGLPTWIPEKPWREYLALRKKLRCVNTPNAEHLLILELNKLREAGHDPKAVIEQSIRKSWRDFFPIKPDNGGRNGGYQKPAHESFAAGLSRSIQEGDRDGGLFGGGSEIIDVTPSRDQERDRDAAA